MTFLGIDDELKDGSSSVYTTNLNSSFFPVPAAVHVCTGIGVVPTYENQQYGVRLVDFTQRTNTKRMIFSLNGALNNINLIK